MPVHKLCRDASIPAVEDENRVYCPVTADILNSFVMHQRIKTAVSLECPLQHICQYLFPLLHEEGIEFE